MVCYNALQFSVSVVLQFGSNLYGIHYMIASVETMPHPIVIVNCYAQRIEEQTLKTNIMH